MPPLRSRKDPLLCLPTPRSTQCISSFISMPPPPPPSGIPAASWTIGQGARFGPIHRGRSAPVRVTLGKIAQYPGKHQILAILHWRKWVQITPLSDRNFRSIQNMAGESSTASTKPKAAAQVSTTAIPSRPANSPVSRTNNDKPTSDVARKQVSTTRPGGDPAMPYFQVPGAFGSKTPGASTRRLPQTR